MIVWHNTTIHASLPAMTRMFMAGPSGAVKSFSETTRHVPEAPASRIEPTGGPTPFFDRIDRLLDAPHGGVCAVSWIRAMDKTET